MYYKIDLYIQFIVYFITMYGSVVLFKNLYYTMSLTRYIIYKEKNGLRIMLIYYNIKNNFYNFTFHFWNYCHFAIVRTIILFLTTLVHCHSFDSIIL